MNSRASSGGLESFANDLLWRKFIISESIAIDENSFIIKY